MTVKALEGTLIIPEAPPPEADLAELGFSPRAIPAGQCAISEAFSPNPDNDPGSTALFNIFIVAPDFSGDVYLVKAAPTDSAKMGKRKFRLLRNGETLKWTMAPSEAVADTVQEPENGVRYYLAAFGATAGQQVHFRMSL